MKPRVAFQVPNTLTGEGNLNVELTFESMDDFSPAAVARKVDSLNKLLQARSQLSNLLTYHGRQAGPRSLIATPLKDPTLLQALAARTQAGRPVSGLRRGEEHCRDRNPEGRPSPSPDLRARRLRPLLQQEFKPDRPAREPWNRPSPPWRPRRWSRRP